MKLAVLVRDLGPSQLSHLLISKTNSFLSGRPDADLTAFYERLVRPCHVPNFACTHIADGWPFEGAVVATTLSTAAKLAKFPAARRKFFYVWDLEWYRLPNKQYRPLAEIYRNPELTLLCRCVDHAAAIAHAWNRTAEVIQDFDVPSLFEAAHGKAG